MFSACHWIWASCFIIINSSPNLDQKRIWISDTVPFCIIFVFFKATSTHCGYITLVSSFKFRCGLNLIKLATFASRSNLGSHNWPIQFLLRNKLTFYVIIWFRSSEESVSSKFMHSKNLYDRPPRKSIWGYFDLQSLWDSILKSWKSPLQDSKKGIGGF